MRITNKISHERAMAGMNQALQRLMGVQEQLSTGKRVNRPSDDPFATHRAISARTRMVFLEQYRVNVRESQAWANTTDMTLSGVGDILQEARVLALQAANAGLSHADRENIAVRIDEFRDSLLQLSSEQYAGRYLFSGTQTATVPFSELAEGEVAYDGNDSLMSRNIAPGASIAVNVPGEDVFMGIGDGSKSVFKVFHDLAEAMRAGDTESITGALGEIDAAIDRVLMKRGEAGAAVNRLERAEFLLSGFVQNEMSLLSDAEDLDLAWGVMQLGMEENAYQVSLAAAARVIMPSLIDYLR